MDRSWQVGDFCFRPELNALEGPAGNLHLEPRTAAVLLDLVAHAGEVRSREELLEAVWQDAFVGEAALTHCIWELRKAFCDDARNPRVIQTVPRRGYRLIVEVSAGRDSGQTTLKTLLRLASVESGPCRELLAEAAEATSSFPVAVDSGLLLLFDRPFDAVRFALACIERLEDGGNPGAQALIHMDEVCAEKSVETPGFVSLESSVTDWVDALIQLARPGQVLLTQAAFDMARRAAGRVESREQAADLRWLAHGSFALEGVEEPVDMFEVGVEGRSPLDAPESSPSARSAHGEGIILGWRPGPGIAVPQRPNWHLMEKLGEGGYGEVWLTQHHKTGERRVFKFCFEAERLRALQREVTLFRLLKESLGDRDDIVHLLDWNFDQAPYFIEMEHTSAGSLWDWVELQGGLDPIPLEVRLELVAQTAEALAAAHSVGVLHKDVKPGNILIHLDRGGVPKVRLGDFGIGRILDHRRLEEAGITVLGMTRLEAGDSSSEGTRLYMSPEVLEGKIPSTEADIYALGVVLFQLAVGELDRAMATGWQRAIDDEILQQDIAQCVDVSPDRRPSARELADRLRSLGQRRQERQREREERELMTAQSQALETSQRRRRQWLGISVLAGLVTTIVSILAYQAVIARSDAEESRLRAEDLVTYMLGDLRNTLSSVGRLDAMDGTLTEVLKYLDTIAPEDLSPSDLARRAEALHQVGEVRIQQGDLDAAQGVFEDAARVSALLVGRDPENGGWRARQADSEYWLGLVLDRRGDAEGAGRAYEGHRAAYEELVREHPEGPSEWRLELAYGHHNVAGIMAKTGRVDDALRHYREKSAIFTELIEEDPENADLRMDLALNHNRIGVIEHRRSRLKEALSAFRADQEVMLGLVEAAPENTRFQERLATSGTYVGSVLVMLGRPSAALEQFRQVLQIRERLFELDPTNATWQRLLAMAKRRVGQALLSQGATEQAQVAFEGALAIWTENEIRLQGPPSARKGHAQRELGALLRLLAESHFELGDPSTSAGFLDRSLAVLEERTLEAPDDLKALTRLSRSYDLSARLAESLGLAAVTKRRQQALEVIEDLAVDSSNPEVLDAYFQALVAAEQWQKAGSVGEKLRTRGYAAAGFAERLQRLEERL